MAETHLGGCNLLLITQCRCLYVVDGDIVPNTLLLTAVSKQMSKWISIPISNRLIY